MPYLQLVLKLAFHTRNMSEVVQETKYISLYLFIYWPFILSNIFMFFDLVRFALLQFILRALSYVLQLKRRLFSLRLVCCVCRQEVVIFILDICCVMVTGFGPV
jgi:hypothetical protein